MSVMWILILQVLASCCEHAANQIASSPPVLKCSKISIFLTFKVWHKLRIFQHAWMCLCVVYPYLFFSKVTSDMVWDLRGYIFFLRMVYLFFLIFKFMFKQMLFRRVEMFFVHQQNKINLITWKQALLDNCPYCTWIT